MAERKVRHATVQYFIPNTKNPVDYKTAFRGQIVDIPEDQVERLDSLYATVPVDADLERPGRMLTLPETAGDAEILSWVMGASNVEVEALVVERPAMAARITSAKESVEQRFQEQNLHLGGLQKIADESAEAQAKLAASTGDAAAADEAARLALGARAAAVMEAQASGAADNSGGTTPAPQPSTTATPAVNNPGDAGTPAGTEDLIGGTGALSSVEADKVIGGNAKAVTDYISENPTHAAAVLEAEGRLATAEKRDLRVSVVRSAEAAAGFTQ